MNSFTYVYIITSLSSPDRFYVGRTNDLNKRLEAHNKGKCTYTEKFKPWRIETAVAFSNEKKALAFEKYLKSGSGRTFQIRHF